MTTEATIVALVLGLGGLVAGGAIVRRVLDHETSDDEARARRVDRHARWTAIVGAATELDASELPSVKPNTLVLVRGRLAGEGARADVLLGIARENALSLQRRAFIRVARATRTERIETQARVPGLGAAAGRSDVLTSPDDRRVVVEVGTSLDWEELRPGARRAEPVPLTSEPADLAPSATLGSTPVDAPLFSRVPRTARVPLDRQALARLDPDIAAAAVVEGDASLVFFGEAPGAVRAHVEEAPAGEYTLLARFDGERLRAPELPSDLHEMPLVFPGRAERAAFQPPPLPPDVPKPVLARLASHRDRMLVAGALGLVGLVLLVVGARGLLQRLGA